MAYDTLNQTGDVERVTENEQEQAELQRDFPALFQIADLPEVESLKVERGLAGSLQVHIESRDGYLFSYQLSEYDEKTMPLDAQMTARINKQSFGARLVTRATVSFQGLEERDLLYAEDGLQAQTWLVRTKGSFIIPEKLKSVQYEPGSDYNFVTALLYYGSSKLAPGNVLLAPLLTGDLGLFVRLHERSHVLSATQPMLNQQAASLTRRNEDVQDLIHAALEMDANDGAFQAFQDIYYSWGIKYDDPLLNNKMQRIVDFGTIVNLTQSSKDARAMVGTLYNERLDRIVALMNQQLDE
jgi:hypothetical protein